MRVIQARNVQEALPLGLLNLLGGHVVERDSRNGPVLVFPTPVTTVYEQPRERVIFWAERDANPFFHLFESLWMLAGRNDTKFLTNFVKTMLNYSDDGKTFHGAYGHRWRHHFGMDQLEIIADTLRDNPEDRRCVLQMWDAGADLGKKGKDFPCNTQVYLSRDAQGRLDMTVCNRSNDMIWGAYGANAVHFSYLQEFMAAWIGCEVGVYYQMSNNLHAYKNESLEKVRELPSTLGATEIWANCPYRNGSVTPYPLVSTPIKEWHQDLLMFLEEGPIVGLRDPFFRRVAIPMWVAYRAFRELEGERRYLIALENLEQCRATDWRLACEEWIHRRYAAWREKAGRV